MPILTPSGLLLRFDEARLEAVVSPLKRGRLYEDLLINVGLWWQLDTLISQLAAMATAFFTHSWQMALVSVIMGKLAGRVISKLGYSDWIRRAGQVGNWMTGAVVCLVLGLTGQKALALTIVGVFLANWSAVLSLVLMPLTYPVSRSCRRQTGMALMDRAFVRLCNQRASRR